MKQIKYKTSFAVVLLVGDIACICCAAVIAYWVRFYSGYFSSALGIVPFSDYAHYLPIVVLVSLLIYRYYGLYGKRNRLHSSVEAGLIFKAIVSTLLVLLALGFFYRGFSFSRLLALIFIVFYLGCALLFRIAFGKIQKYYFKKKGIGNRVVIVGTHDNAVELAEFLRKNIRSGYFVVGMIGFSKEAIPSFKAAVPFLGAVDSFDEILIQYQVDEVIISSQKVSHETIMSLIVQAEKNLVKCKIVADLFELITSKVEVHHIGPFSLIGIKEIPLANVWNRLIKRCFDIAGSSVGLVFLSPLMLLLSVLIKVDSRGKIIFKQERVGEDGQHFMIYKFRTMHVNAEQESGPVWATPEDPRTTRVGRWLRRFNCDEIPQLFNVLKGDMSLVGPRPERPHFVAQFKENIPRYMSRHWVKSGVTGWAQVNGLRGQTSLEERVKFDLYYIENWSLLFDCKIIGMSLFALKNAY